MPHYRYWENPNLGEHGGQPIEPPEPLEFPLQLVQSGEPEQLAQPEPETKPECRCPEKKCLEDCRCNEDCKCKKDAGKKKKKKKDEKKRRKRDELDRTGRCPAHTRSPWGAREHTLGVRLRYILMAGLCFVFLGAIGIVLVTVILERYKPLNESDENTSDRRSDSVDDRVVTEWRKAGDVALVDHSKHDIAASEDDMSSVDTISQVREGLVLLLHFA